MRRVALLERKKLLIREDVRGGAAMRSQGDMRLSHHACKPPTPPTHTKYCRPQQFEDSGSETSSTRQVSQPVCSGEAMILTLHRHWQSYAFVPLDSDPDVASVNVGGQCYNGIHCTRGGGQTLTIVASQSDNTPKDESVSKRLPPGWRKKMSRRTGLMHGWSSGLCA